MPIHIRGSYFFVSPGEPSFLVSSNFTNYLELGRPGTDDFFLVAYIQEKQHLIDAALFNPEGKPQCRIVRNHIDTIYDGDWKVKTIVDGGFIVTNSRDNVLAKVALKGDVCLIEGDFYNRARELVAKGEGGDFLIFKGPAVIGKSGLSRGIVIGG